MAATTPGPDVPMIEEAARIIRAKMREPHTGPYHWAGALWQAGMLVPAGTATPTSQVRSDGG